MTASAFTIYSRNKDDININDIVGATVKVALVSSAYSPSTDSATGNSVWADASGSEISGGNGYTTGGATLTTPVATAIAGGFKYVTDNVVWTATGGAIPAWRYAVVYVSGSLWGLTNPLIGYLIGDNTPADIPSTTDTNTLTLTVPSGGWFSVS